MAASVFKIVLCVYDIYIYIYQHAASYLLFATASVLQVIRSVHFAYDSKGVNLTLQALQAALVRNLQKCSDPATTVLPQKLTLHYVLGKGDWKFKAEFLREKRTYSNLKRKSAGIGFCRRCESTSDLARKHWLDASGFSFYEPDRVEGILSSSMPHELPLRQLAGYHPDMEAADTLHNLWLGPAKDTLGSVIMEICEHHPALADFASFSEALQALASEFHRWCARNQMDPSTVDEFSCLY